MGEAKGASFWSILPSIISLLGLGFNVFGSKKSSNGEDQEADQKQTTTTTNPDYKYRSALLPLLESIMTQGGLSNLMTMQNAGMPAGSVGPMGRFGLGNLGGSTGMANDLIALLQKSWPTMVSDAESGNAGGGSQGLNPEQGQTACIEYCRNRYPSWKQTEADAEYRKCIANCNQNRGS